MKRLKSLIRDVRKGGKAPKVTKVKISKSWVWDKSVLGPMGGKK